MGELAKIRIVEDDATIRALLEMALLGAGYGDVASSARGDEGLRAVERDKPDLVLLDVMLPGSTDSPSRGGSARRRTSPRRASSC